MKNKFKNKINTHKLSLAFGIEGKGVVDIDFDRVKQYVFTSQFSSQMGRTG